MGQAIDREDWAGPQSKSEPFFRRVGMLDCDFVQGICINIKVMRRIEDENDFFESGPLLDVTKHRGQGYPCRLLNRISVRARPQRGEGYASIPKLVGQHQTPTVGALQLSGLRLPSTFPAGSDSMDDMPRSKFPSTGMDGTPVAQPPILRHSSIRLRPAAR